MDLVLTKPSDLRAMIKGINRGRDGSCLVQCYLAQRHDDWLKQRLTRLVSCAEGCGSVIMGLARHGITNCWRGVLCFPPYPDIIGGEAVIDFFSQAIAPVQPIRKHMNTNVSIDTFTSDEARGGSYFFSYNGAPGRFNIAWGRFEFTVRCGRNGAHVSRLDVHVEQAPVPVESLGMHVDWHQSKSLPGTSSFRRHSDRTRRETRRLKEAAC